ncbi:uncharacterized protein B0T15DRAFT_5310 [Chaetomium strumarium]|uniref:PAS domain-containing protein n=1 Tax=Chaetomium strumarium TaxID=1170767 RepID=A0AAJ0M574_9PEZI|nr:hypothetical protein B0T15DRAFT_5310 [Chaetomium strumarium]
MSHRPPSPAGFLNYGAPASLAPGMTRTLQSNTNPSDAGSLFYLDPFLLSVDGTMSTGFDFSSRLPPPFVTAAVQPSSTALMGSTQQPLFPRGDRAGSGLDAFHAPQDSLGSDNPSSVSTVTEFTKRRNWPAKVVEELPDLLQILDDKGRIKHVSRSAKRLTGYDPSELLGKVMHELLHQDDVGTFTAQLNEAIAHGTQLRVFYRFRKKSGTYCVFEAVGHGHVAANKFAPSPDNQTPLCHAVFMMARPYPTRNAALLDSFLEHKIENERLKRRIAELQREEQDEAEESDRAWQWSQEATPAESGGLRLGPTPLAFSHTPGAPQERRLSLDSGTSESTAGIRHPSVGATHADTIEMLTGLRYQEGERSQGITTGNPSPALITGDVGIAITVDRDQRMGEKKKKVKTAEEHLCKTCAESPEWRKGPDGPKTLCNACGLRWAKKEKKNLKSTHSGGTTNSENTPHGSATVG